ncbi:MAG: hypothetical protein AAFU80_08430 [Pseudomonadota bacterium]
MSDARTGGIVATVTLLVVALALIALVFGGGRDRRLGSSATGFDGLVHWLRAEGIEARNFGGGYPLDASAVALRVLPLFDAEPGEQRSLPRTRDDVMMLDTERELQWPVIEAKVNATPTLIVLPKWRRGARLTGIAHPDLLIPDARLRDVTTRLLGNEARLSTNASAGIATVSLAASEHTHSAALYAPRTALGSTCKMVLGEPQAAFLLECLRKSKDGESFVFVLTDPDLISNHGLALGDNAALALAILPRLAETPGPEGRGIVIDYSSEFWTRDGPPPEPEPRTWGEILALFRWPYSLIWTSFAVAFLLALWRGSVRFGPPVQPRGPAPLAPTDAEARLLQLSGERGRLLADYADRRLAALTQRLLGPRIGTSTLIGLLPRRAPKSGPLLLAEAERFHTQPAMIASATAMAQMRTFETLIDQVIDEFD